MVAYCVLFFAFFVGGMLWADSLLLVSSVLSLSSVKPLKDCICVGWEEWMIQEGLARRKPPTCKQVTNWTVNAYNDTSNEIGGMHGGMKSTAGLTINAGQWYC